MPKAIVNPSLEYVGESKTYRHGMYKCACGNVKSIKKTHVKLGKILTCGQCCINQLPGSKIDKITVIKYIEKRKRHYYFLCKCECGNELEVKSTMLKTTTKNHIRSCGKCIDKNYLLGKKFGLLKVKQWVGQKHSAGLWECECECGKVTNVTSCNLQQGHTKSCGCFHKVSPYIRGEHKGKATKLNDEKVMLIRHMYYFERMMRKRHRTAGRKYRYTMQDIADEFGVSQHCVSACLKGKRWAHLPNPNNIKNKDLRSQIYHYD